MNELNWLDPSCPWTSFKLAHLVTCEARHCSWVRQSTNTYSNLAFILAALWLIDRYRKFKVPSDRDFAILAVLAGLASTFSHASQTALSSYFDFSLTSTMFFFCLGVNVLRMQRRPLTEWPWWRAGLLSLAAFLPIGGLYPVSFILTGVTLAAVFTEIKAPEKSSKNFFWLSVSTLTVAVVAFVLDAEKIVCIPDEPWLQLHSAWHILAAVSMGFMATHYFKLSKRKA